MSDGPGRIERSKDLYKVHDSSKKQKKERKAGDEKEFLELLEESDKDLEGYEQEKPMRDPTPQQPTKSLLDRLSASAPPPVQFVDDSDGSKDGPA
ncbi:MAG: hypothetical protein WCX65_16725 [bacterium]